MINRLHSFVHRPEKGWDPIPPDYAVKYAEAEWKNLSINGSLVDQLEIWINGLKGKRVLDLGGGPGQFSVTFARRGACVTWHDVSVTYMSLAQDRATKEGLEIEFSLGYLEDSKRFATKPFDLVFNRLAWSYSMNDLGFARLIYSLVKPGGAGYIDAHTPEFEKPHGVRRTLCVLNALLGWKIGHPHPPHTRIATLLQKFPIEFMVLDYSFTSNDRVFFRKPSK